METSGTPTPAFSLSKGTPTPHIPGQGWKVDVTPLPLVSACWLFTGSQAGAGAHVWGCFTGHVALMTLGSSPAVGPECVALGGLVGCRGSRRCGRNNSAPEDTETDVGHLGAWDCGRGQCWGGWFKSCGWGVQEPRWVNTVGSLRADR